MCVFCCNFVPDLCSNWMKRIIGIGLLVCCFCVIRAQEVLILPYEASSLTEEQKAMNPERLAYPTEMKETILKEVNFECTPQEVELGPFSVSAFNMVYFSPGNLQFNAMLGTHQCKDGTSQKGTWRFAEHQWDYVGDKDNGTVKEGGTKCDNSKINATYNGWIDLFGWGTSGWDSGANAYKPYATSEKDKDYCPGGYDNTNLTGTYANADWGVYNQIGSSPAGKWRTLTKDEWMYVLHERSDANALRALGTVNGVLGLILLPDHYAFPSGVTYTSGNDKGFDTNVYNTEQWAKFEEKGAVFLPAAGIRGGTTVEEVMDYGAYWSASYNTNYKSNAWYVAFVSQAGGTSNIGRHMGFSVRVVKDVEFEPVPTELKKK